MNAATRVSRESVHPVLDGLRPVHQSQPCFVLQNSPRLMSVQTNLQGDSPGPERGLKRLVVRGDQLCGGIDL